MASWTPVAPCEWPVSDFVAEIGGHFSPEPKTCAQSLDFLEVADRRRGGVRIDVVDRRLDGRQRLAHAPGGALARRRDHVMAVRSRAVADDLGVDLRPPRLGAFIFLEDQNAGAGGNDKSVAVLVVGARGARGRCR